MIEYSIAPSSGDGARYFYIHPKTGVITLLSSVLETEATIYRVSAHFFLTGIIFDNFAMKQITQNLV